MFQAVCDSCIKIKSRNVAPVMQASTYLDVYRWMDARRCVCAFVCMHVAWRGVAWRGVAWCSMP